MTDPAPPLTEAELRKFLADVEPGGPENGLSLDDATRLVRRALTLESELTQLRLENERRMAQLGRLYEPLLPLIEREHSRHPHLTLSDEAVDAVTALAEREELCRRTVALLDDGWSLYFGRGADGTCEATLESVHVSHLGTGPTYEAALAAALKKVEKA